MSTSKHARAVASAGPSDGVNRPLPSLQSNRDQGGSLALTCEGPKPAKKHAAQHNLIVFSFALLNLREVAHIALLTGPEQDGDPLRRGYSAD